MTPEEIAALSEMLARATPEPWYLRNKRHLSRSSSPRNMGDGMPTNNIAVFNEREDAELAVELRAVVPKLIAALTAAHAERDIVAGFLNETRAMNAIMVEKLELGTKSANESTEMMAKATAELARMAEVSRENDDLRQYSVDVSDVVNAALAFVFDDNVEDSRSLDAAAFAFGAKGRYIRPVSDEAVAGIRTDPAPSSLIERAMRAEAELEMTRPIVLSAQDLIKSGGLEETSKIVAKLREEVARHKRVSAEMRDTPPRRKDVLS